MSKHRNINPMDSVDLAFLAQSFDDNIGNLYVKATVYGPDNSTIANSPFILTKIAGTNLFVNKGAFQADTDSGTYIVTYQPYSDSGYTTKSPIIGQEIETITVKIQSTTGIGSNSSQGGDVIVEMDEVVKELKDIKKEQGEAKKRQIKLSSDIKNGVSINVPEKINDNVEMLIAELKGSVFKVIGDLKDTVNNIERMDKEEIGIYLNGLNDKNEKKKLEEIKRSLSGILPDFESRTRTLFKSIKKENDGNLVKVLSVVNTLNESVRKKLSYAIEMILKTRKIDINIKNKDEKTFP